jgi:hypothetical protein
MPKNSESVSLKRDELEKLISLHRLAWGNYNNKTADKLERALARIDRRVADSEKE